MRPNDQITLRFRSVEASGANNESDLRQYLLEDKLEVKIAQEFVESVH
jgi:hypothetical protein